MPKKLSLQNAKKQVVEYMIYIITMVITVALLLSFNMIIFSEEIAAIINEKSILPLILITVSVLVVLVISAYMIEASFWLTSATLAATVMLLLLPAHVIKKFSSKHKVRLALAGVFIMGLFLHIPMYLTEYSGEQLSGLNGFISAFHHTLRMFVLDGELEPIKTFADQYAGSYATLFFLTAEISYILGPLLTGGVILSFFENTFSYLVLYTHPFSNYFVFSDLNEQSLCLAESIKTNSPKTRIVFTDVYTDETEAGTELQTAAADLGALCFKCDLLALRLGVHKRTSRLIRLFIMGKDEDEKIKQASLLIQRHGDNPHVELYIFSDSIESSLLTQTMQPKGMKVRRISDAKSLINDILYRNGSMLFEQADGSADKNKDISAVVLGLGSYGTQMLKALPWFGQMDGYNLTITAVDLQRDAADRFAFQCPELMSPKRNGVIEDGEAQYLINIHSGMNVFSAQFENMLSSLPSVTYCFIALGNDRLNIETAVHLRELCERFHFKPVIQAVVYDVVSARQFCMATNFRGKPYNICCVGSIQERYSEDAIIASELEKEALLRHLRWGDEESFWRYEFNYHSSVASALHHRLKLACHIPGADLPPEERTPEDRDRLRLMEHRRWNAYMRSEGYCYSGSRDKQSRNDLAKLHNDLVPFDALTEEEKAKDDV